MPTFEEMVAAMSASGPDGEGAEHWLDCARINLRNVVKMNPSIGRDPIFALAAAQVDIALAAVKAGDD